MPLVKKADFLQALHFKENWLRLDLKNKIIIKKKSNKHDTIALKSNPIQLYTKTKYGRAPVAQLANVIFKVKSQRSVGYVIQGLHAEVRGWVG